MYMREGERLRNEIYDDPSISQEIKDRLRRNLDEIVDEYKEWKQHQDKLATEAAEKEKETTAAANPTKEGEQKVNPLVIRRKPATGEPEEPRQYKRINKKNVKDMNVKQNEKISKDKLNTKVEPVVKTSEFNKFQDQRNKRFLFGQTKITFRRPEDVVKKSRSMLY